MLSTLPSPTSDLVVAALAAITIVASLVLSTLPRPTLALVVSLLIILSPALPGVLPFLKFVSFVLSPLENTLFVKELLPIWKVNLPSVLSVGNVTLF